MERTRMGYVLGVKKKNDPKMRELCTAFITQNAVHGLGTWALLEAC